MPPAFEDGTFLSLCKLARARGAKPWGCCRAVENVADYLVGKNWRQEGRRIAQSLEPVYEDEKPRRIEDWRQIEDAQQPVRPLEQPPRSGWSVPRVWDGGIQGWAYPSRKGEEVEGETSGREHENFESFFSRKGERGVVSQPEKSVAWHVYKTYAGFEALAEQVIKAASPSVVLGKGLQS